jgi:hypothetical protein
MALAMALAGLGVGPVVGASPVGAVPSPAAASGISAEQTSGTGGPGVSAEQMSSTALLQLSDFPAGFAALGSSGPSSTVGTERGVDDQVAPCAGGGLTGAIGSAATGEASPTFVRAESLLVTDTVTVVGDQAAADLGVVRAVHYRRCLSSVLDTLVTDERFGGSSAVKVSPATVSTVRPAVGGPSAEVVATVTLTGAGPPTELYLASVFIARDGLLSELSLQAAGRPFPIRLGRTLEQRAVARMTAAEG